MRLVLVFWVVYCSLLHMAWAGLIHLNSAAIWATPVNALYGVFKADIVLIVALIISSALALASLFINLPWTAVLLMPQQCLLLISATGVIAAIWYSQYSDGVVRPWEFIASDQIHIVMKALFHTIAIVIGFRRW